MGSHPVRLLASNRDWSGGVVVPKEESWTRNVDAKTTRMRLGTATVLISRHQRATRVHWAFFKGSSTGKLEVETQK